MNIERCIFMLWVETIVCSSKQGVDARLRRMLNARQEFKRRQKGCVAAWVGRAPDNSEMLLVQSVFQSSTDWKRISELIQSTLDAEDGGIDGLLLGPPLVGVFEIHPSELSFDISEN
jgi:hypothetical protein